jgi:hypothetical protein
MTPKEKAKQLVELFSYNCYECDYWFNAHASAHRHVDEILDFIEDERIGFNWKDYYKEVKKEIGTYGE